MYQSPNHSPSLFSDVLLLLGAGNAGLALPENAEHVMLRLDDEIAGLIEAADVPAAPDSAHSTVPEAVSSVPGARNIAFSLLCCHASHYQPCLDTLRSITNYCDSRCH